MEIRNDDTKMSWLYVSLLFLLVMPCMGLTRLVDSKVIPTDTALLPSSSDYKLQVLLAQADAKCLQHFGGRKNKTVEYDVYVPFTCIVGSSTFSQCEQCRKITAGVPTREECSKFCKNVSWNGCRERCEHIIESVKHSQTAKHSNETTDHWSQSIKNVQSNDFLGNEKESSLNQFPAKPVSRILLESPKIFCENVLPVKSSQKVEFNSQESHTVFLTWNIRTQFHTVKDNMSAYIQSTPSQTPSFPIVFVLEQHSPDYPHWITLGKTSSGLEPVQVPYRAQRFTWRVTAVGPDGVYGRASSEEFTTVDGYKEPGPPKRIFVVNEVLRQEMVDVLIGWDPPPERPCAYKIMLHPLDDTSVRAQTSRLNVNEALGVHQQWFRGLKFGGINDVTITSRTSHFESTLLSQKFTTMSCLAAYGHRFDKCDPPAPTNVSHVILSSGEIEENGKVHVRLHWRAPLYTSISNPIENYTISLGPTYNATGHNQSLTGATYRSQAVSGNTTELDLGFLLSNTQYAVIIHASSTKGRSPPAEYILSTKLGRTDEYKSTTSKWFYLSLPMSAVVMLLFGCHFVRMYLHKRQVKLARNQYFQSMEERDALACGWSIAPLNEDSPSFKLLTDFPKEKWEIGYENLKMGEIIGQGAFGVVRRAKMARKTLRVLSQKYSNLFSMDNVDGTGMETVAVKMLKVAATRDDRDQLIKEIVTMQNLGCHPQIVSLLGACTKGRSLCLVLEYCPGGDLLTFLRKVRAKYWPMLGFSGDRQSRSSKSSTKSESNRGVPGGDSDGTFVSVDRRSGVSSPINYADMGSFSSSSDSPDKSSPPTIPSSVLPNYRSTENEMNNFRCDPDFENNLLNPASSSDPEDDCHPIDERDVLSYARQVALGMEYLEKNHVVHRDLAGRNVLLLGDYKQVKISDFGLSRDIYTWNVYHQKSNGKLPIKWMSIESIFTHIFTTKSDVWSYGILLWELVTLGGTPYPGVGNTELFHLLKSGYRMERPDNCSEELYALMKKCWRTDAVSRPNFTELHRFLETMLEAAEPGLYLSLMPDLPSDYFQIGYRTEMPGLKDEFIPSRQNSHQSCQSNNRILNSQTNPDNSTPCGQGHSWSLNCSNTCCSSANNNHYSRENSSRSSSTRKSRPRQPSPPPRPPLITPDSGIHPRDMECDSGHEEGAITTSTCSDKDELESTPLKCINNITIIENKTYDITNL